MIDLRRLGYNEQVVDIAGDYLLGRIVAVHRELYKVICNSGERDAVLKASIYHHGEAGEIFPTVGDFVLIDYNVSGSSRIVKTLERKSYFSRKDPDVGRGEQVVAANFDYVFILMSLNHDFNLKRLERYLAASWQSGGIPVVVLTKADLTPNYEDLVKQVADTAIGVEVIVISSKTGFGLENLNKFIQPGKTIVCLGSSGVGKSSLVNALLGADCMKTSGIREEDSKGHHTTTYRQLLFLENGAMLIDTPGMRELGMWDITTGLGETFVDIEGLIQQCKFSDCTHHNEPGCAINEALINGDLLPTRWQSYLKLQKEAAYSANKALYFQRVKEKAKSNAKFIKQKKQARNKDQYNKGDF